MNGIVGGNENTRIEVSLNQNKKVNQWILPINSIVQKENQHPEPGQQNGCGKVEAPIANLCWFERNCGWRHFLIHLWANDMLIENVHFFWRVNLTHF